MGEEVVSDPETLLGEWVRHFSKLAESRRLRLAFRLLGRRCMESLTTEYAGIVDI